LVGGKEQETKQIYSLCRSLDSNTEREQGQGQEELGHWVGCTFKDSLGSLTEKGMLELVAEETRDPAGKHAIVTGSRKC
jgi:hypothetical protein